MMKLKAYLIFFVSWLFPGSGHFIQKKYLKGSIFLVGVLSLLIMGLFMKGEIYVLEAGKLHPLKILGFLGDLGSGIFFLLIKLIGLDMHSDISAVTHSYGTTYIVTAGLLNYLIALNAFDIALGKRK
jgi:hypothetical protein